ncbi:phosphoenolpyruvate carboxykinase (ATP) [bacterium]|nr:phosphoenolpyruvate carboxykinase (ATP) [bacterium]
MTLSRQELVEEALKTQNVRLSDSGALIAETGRYTGRAPENRFIANHPEISNDVDWGANNQPMEPQLVSEVIKKVADHVSTQRKYNFSGFLGAFSLRLHSVSAWHTLFALNMFRRDRGLAKLPEGSEIEIFHAPFTSPQQLGINVEQKALVVLDFVNRKIAICGTEYAGEIKKSAFTMANFLFPAMGILPMHASANCMPDGSNSCVLFGLSGTGKTTLSADPERALIGDDEIIWTDRGISNLEGGCYAKLIRLSEKSEPEIYKAVNQYGAIEENVVVDPRTGCVDYDNDTITENTRGSYPLEFLSSIYNVDKVASEPTSIVFLTADAFGALPAVAKLSPEQAIYHFVSGYTAKVAGTELGVKEPKAVFSTCFGAPFMPRAPMEYARMLAQKAAKSGASFWLLNTGWANGGYGKGDRFPLSVSRALLKAIQNKSLDQSKTVKHPVFGFEVPVSCQGVDEKWLRPPEGDQVGALQKEFEANPVVRRAGLTF